MQAGEILKKKREDILRIGEAHGARNIRVFGSVSRGEAREQSDIDLLVEMQAGRSLFDLIALGQELEELLGRKVDILTDGGVSPYLKDRIYAEAKKL